MMVFVKRIRYYLLIGNMMTGNLYTLKQAKRARRLYQHWQYIRQMWAWASP